MIREHVLRRRSAERDALLARAAAYVEELEREGELEAAVVFGSVARGDFNLWSDVDLLVVADRFGGGWRERERRLGSPPPSVQPIGWTPAEWRRQLDRGNPIATEARGRGVWIRGGPERL